MRIRFSIAILSILAVLLIAPAHATALTATIQACANGVNASPTCSNFVSSNPSNDWQVDQGQTVSFQGLGTGGTEGCYEASSPYEQFSSCPPSGVSYYEGKYFFTYSIGGPLTNPSYACPGGTDYNNEYWGSPSSGPQNNPWADSPFPTFYIQNSGDIGIAFTTSETSTTDTTCYSSFYGDITPISLTVFNAGASNPGDTFVSSPEYSLIINPALAGTPTISATNSILAVGKTTTITLSTTGWVNGTAPYTVEFAETDPAESDSCSSLAGAASTNVTTSNTVSYSFTITPTQSQVGDYYYCATINDSSLSPEVLQAGPVELQVVDPLSGVTISSPTGDVMVDAGEYIPVDVSWTGGGSPYNVTLYSGTSSSCSSDSAVAYTNNGISSTITEFNVQVPSSGSTIYYCAKVTDSEPSSASTSTPLEFTINPEMSTPAVTAVSSNVIYSGGETSIQISWSGGTPDYTYALTYGSSSTSCALDNNDAGGQTQPGTLVETAVAPTSGTTYYCAQVTDQAYEPITAYSTTPLPVTVTSEVNGQAISTTTPEVDTGNPITLKATWGDGIGPFTVTFYSSSTSSCSGLTEVGQTTVSNGATSAQYTFAAPSVSPTLPLRSVAVYYCAEVEDYQNNAVYTAATSVGVSQDPYISASGSQTVDVGQSILIIPSVATINYGSGTSASDTFSWYNGTNPTPISGQTSEDYSATGGATGTFDYYPAITDTNGNTAISATPEAVTIVADPTLSMLTPGPFAYDVNVIPSSIVAEIIYSGTATTPVAWYSSSTPSCGSSSTPTGTSGTSFTPSTSTIGVTYYCAVVSDNNVPGYQSTSAAVEVTISADPSFGTPGVTIPNAIIDTGQSDTITANVFNGTSPYTFIWTLKGNVLGQTTQSITFTGNTSDLGTDNLQVTATDNFGLTANASGTISVVPRVTFGTTALIFPNSTIESGQSENVIANVIEGVTPYSYIWELNGNVLGQTGNTITFNGNASDVGLDTITVIATDGNKQTAMYANTIRVNATPIVTLTPSSASLFVGQEETVNAHISGGLGPFTLEFVYSNGTVAASENAIPFNGGEAYSFTPWETGTVTINAIGNDTAVPLIFNSTELSIPVSNSFAVSINPSNATTTLNNKVTLTANVVGGSGNFDYQWYNYTGGVANAITGANTLNLSIAASAQGKFYYFITVNDTTASVVIQSFNATLTVNNPSGGSGGGAGTGGSAPLGPTITTQGSCTTILNFSTLNTVSFTLGGADFTVVENFISPNQAGVTINGTSYTLTLDQNVSIGGSFDAELTSDPYIPVQHMITLSICTSAPQSQANTTTTTTTTTNTSPPTLNPTNSTVGSTNSTTAASNSTAQHTGSTSPGNSTSGGSSASNNTATQSKSNAGLPTAFIAVIVAILAAIIIGYLAFGNKKGKSRRKKH